MFRNPELKRDLYIFVALTVLLGAIGFCVSLSSGLLVVTSCLTCTCFHFYAEYKRYLRLQKLSSDLDILIDSGIPLSIGEYAEGELSILANQIQKITVQLLESQNMLREDKLLLANSLADISHQIRTPLTAMNLTATMLGVPELSDERRYELTIEIRNLLSRIEWLVDALLKQSKLNAGIVAMVRESISVRTLIKHSASPLAIPMDLRDQKLYVNCNDEHFFGDITWTSEAMINILKNCMEHTPEGGIITVDVEETPLYTQIVVEDTGNGFDAADIPHLFERFYKGSNSSKSSYGIGLSLARNIIAAQNGTIQALNGSTGAKFIIKFYKQII